MRRMERRMGRGRGRSVRGENDVDDWLQLLKRNVKCPREIMAVNFLFIIFLRRSSHNERIWFSLYCFTPFFIL